MSRGFTSTYHDTPDRRFARAGIALRRRTENGLSTWEVELPDGPDTVAFSQPGGPAEPPPLVADLLQGLLRERDLVEVTTLQTSPSKPLERPQPPASTRKVSSQAHIQAMLRAQYEEILAHDPGTRLGTDPEALHKLRVAVRRLRAVLRVARRMLDREWTRDLRAELSWLGGALGRVRDLDVLLLHLRAEAASLPRGDSQALYRIIETFEAERKTARAALLEVLSSDRYLSLLSRLEGAAEAPSWNGRQRSVRKLAAIEFRKLERAVKALPDDPADEELHRARVRGKRARYAAELAEAAVGKKASRFIARAKRFQDVVGEHQDAVVAEGRLRDAVHGLSDQRAVFVAGRLAERERGRRSAARSEVPKAWKKLRRAGRRAWR